MALRDVSEEEVLRSLLCSVHWWLLAELKPLAKQSPTFARARDWPSRQAPRAPKHAGGTNLGGKWRCSAGQRPRTNRPWSQSSIAWRGFGLQYSRPDSVRRSSDPLTYPCHGETANRRARRTDDDRGAVLTLLCREDLMLGCLGWDAVEVGGRVEED